MATIYLTGKEPLVSRIAAAVGYRGKKFQLETRERIDTQADAHWSGGSRSTYTFVNLATMATLAGPRTSAPWDRTPADTTVPIPVGFACVEHVIYRGKDLGLHIHVNPAGVAPLLPEPTNVELTDNEKRVLAEASSLISSARWKGQGYAEALASLQAKGLMSKNRAITVEGKNLARTLPRARTDLQRRNPHATTCGSDR